MKVSFQIETEEEMLDLAAHLADAADAGSLIFLKGDLGAGKTTLARGFIKSLGYQGAVKSPTYTLVECYTGIQQPVYHFDLYRLENPEEIEFFGFRDYLDGSSLVLVEWPECGQGFLPDPDATILIESDHCSRTLSFSANTIQGRALIKTAQSWSISSAIAQ